MVAERHFFAVSLAIRAVLCVHVVADRPSMLSSMIAVTFVQVSINCTQGGSRILTLSSSPIMRTLRANLRPSTSCINRSV